MDYLPEIQVDKPDQLLTLNDSQGNLVYVIRINGTTFRPRVFRKGTYSVIIGEGPEERKIDGIRSGSGGSIQEKGK